MPESDVSLMLGVEQETLAESKDPILSSQDPKRFELQKLVLDFEP